MSGPVAEYPIRARIVVGKFDTSGIKPGIEETKDDLDEVAKKGLGIGSAIAAGMVAAIAALGFGVTKAISLGIEMENAQSNIASVYMAMEGLDAAAAQTIGKSVIAQLSEDAAKGVGELQNYVEAYQGIFAPARAAGASQDQIRQLTKLTLSAGFGLQGQRGLINAPLDIQQALTAGANERTTPIVMAALRASGVTGDQFNKADKGKQLDMLMAGFGHFEGAAALMGATVEAQAATMTDTTKRLFRESSTPIFEGFKRGLTGANKELDEHKDRLGTMTHALSSASRGLGILVERSVEGAAKLATSIAEAPNWDNVDAAGQRLAYRLQQTGGEVRNFGQGLGFVLAGLQSTSMNVAEGTLNMLMDVQAEAASSRMLAMQAFGYAMGALGLERQAVLPMDAYAQLGMPESPTSDYSVVEMTLDETRKILEAEKKPKKPQKHTIELLARVEWGNDRSLVVPLKGALGQLADRMSRAGTESALGVDLGD